MSTPTGSLHTWDMPKDRSSRYRTATAAAANAGEGTKGPGGRPTRDVFTDGRRLPLQGSVQVINAACIPVFFNCAARKPLDGLGLA